MTDRIAEFTEKVGANPRDTLARFVLAKDLLKAGSLEPAIEHLSELTRQKADWMKVWILLGQALLAGRREAEARTALAEALRLARVQHHEGPEAEIRDLLGSLGE